MAVIILLISLPFLALGIYGLKKKKVPSLSPMIGTIYKDRLPAMYWMMIVIYFVVGITSFITSILMALGI